jgi:glycerol-3-phosphate dehydrogenase
MLVEQKKFLSQAFRDLFGQQHSYAVLSGPSFADEILSNFPTLLVCASDNEETALRVQK